MRPLSGSGKKRVAMGASAVHILSTMPNSPVTLTTSEGYYETYGSLEGTSMPTPHVAGEEELVWAATYSSRTKLCGTNVCVRNRIEGRPTKSPDSPTTGPTDGASTP
jgi:subtilisin family serine protease